MSMKLRISKWRNRLAMLLQSEFVRRFGLREGDRVEAQLTGEGALTVRPAVRSRRAFAAELAEAREALPMGRQAIEELRGRARY